MKKKDAELQEKLLNIARNMVNTSGTDSLNIRAIANQAGISIGTIYNYYTSKEDILLTLTEEYWKNTLVEMKREIHDGAFAEQLREVYFFLKNRILNSSGLLLNGIKPLDEYGHLRMATMQKVLNFYIITLIIQDYSIKDSIWEPTFTLENYACFISNNLLMLISGCSLSIDFLVNIVKKTLYR